MERPQWTSQYNLCPGTQEKCNSSCVFFGEHCCKFLLFVDKAISYLDILLAEKLSDKPKTNGFSTSMSHYDKQQPAVKQSVRRTTL